MDENKYLISPPPEKEKTQLKQHPYDRYVAVGISGLALVISGLSLSEAHQSRRIAEAGQAPLLEILSANFDKNNNLVLHCRNFGPSTAFRVITTWVYHFGAEEFDATTTPKFRTKFIFPREGGSISVRNPDIATGPEFDVAVSIPDHQYLKAHNFPYVEGMDIQLRGQVSYSDAKDNNYQLPWCYEVVELDPAKPGWAVCADY